MDHHGVLTTLQKIGMSLREQQQARKELTPTWSWAKNILIAPEIECFACYTVCKTDIAMLYDEPTKTIIGQFQVQQQKLLLGTPFHTHSHGESGRMCMGNAKTLLALLMSPPNMHHDHAWDVKMVQWSHRYMHHDCVPMHKWWHLNFPTYKYPWDGGFKALKLSEEDHKAILLRNGVTVTEPPDELDELDNEPENEPEEDA